MIVNCTRHWVHLRKEDGTTVSWAPAASQDVARIFRKYIALEPVEGCQTFAAEPTVRIYDLPAEREGVWLIVSTPVFDACPHRFDLLVPDRLERDDVGRVTGCRSFRRRETL